MKKFLKRYRHLTALFAVLMIAFAFTMLGAPVALALFLVASWQLVQFAQSKRCGALYTTPMFTPEQVKEFDGIMAKLLGGDDATNMKDWREKMKGVAELPGKVATLETENSTLKAELGNTRKLLALRSAAVARKAGTVSLECARFLGAAFVAGNAKSGRLDILGKDIRERLFTEARAALGMEVKAAMSTTDIPLPSEYFGEVRELISDFGVARKKMQTFPIGMGTAKPPRFKTRPTFGSIAMSAAFAEKNPQVEFASLESHKIGGIVRLPREIDEQSIVPMGLFLAKYGAVEFARAEDIWAFLADGTATYESVKGIIQIATDNGKTLSLAAGKTKPSDVTRDDIRNLRSKVNKAALSGNRSAYYFDSTWEATLRGMNDKDQPNFFVILPDGSARIDGYQVVWTDVCQPYSTAAAAGKAICVFGALDYWWMGEKGSPRMDFSSDVYFATDELATRFIEEIDFDYQQVDVTGALLTAAQ